MPIITLLNVLQELYQSNQITKWVTQNHKMGYSKPQNGLLKLQTINHKMGYLPVLVSGKPFLYI